LKFVHQVNPKLIFMKFKGLQFLVSTAAAIIFCSYILYETGEKRPTSTSEIDRTKDKVLLDVLVKSIENSHFQPKLLNDQFSEDVYSLYLKRLDYNKRFLLSSDVEKLSEYQTKIDDQIKAGNYVFFDLTNELLKERVSEVKEFYQDILDNPFDFSSNETIELDEEKRDFQKNKKDLKSFWHKSLKYEALTRIMIWSASRRRRQKKMIHLRFCLLTKWRQKREKICEKATTAFLIVWKSGLVTISKKSI
jgi:carboxyl-terminal processing protease